MVRELALFLSLSALGACATLAEDPLPSWNESGPKHALTSFVERVTEPGSPDFVPEPERIAVFDNDGTLWTEQPLYTQLAFALERVRKLAPEHPEWKEQEPFKALLANDMQAVLAGGEKALITLVMASHAGMTSEEFRTLVTDWLAAARHPTLGRPYTACVYAPMLELLAYLRANGFKTYIVSGGGVDFMRPWTEAVYGIPPEQVVGSTIAMRFDVKLGELVRLPELDFVDDKEGKPVGIERSIGRRPILAFGNSDGDLAMLQWTAAGSGARFLGLVHHTDAAREFAYDRESHIGTLDKALDEAGARGWTVVDMKNDWRAVFSTRR